MYNKILKRIIDLVISLMLFPIFCLIFVVVAICIEIDDFGPVFYCADRLGFKGKAFKMYKFRSMKVNSPDIRNEDGTTYNSKDDTRVTKIGKVLRLTSIDELPQIINVIKGDMSIIGPRPDLLDAMSLYDSKTVKKLMVRPGITGYSQVCYRNSSSLEERFSADIYYKNNVSLRLDLKIIFMTIKSVLTKKNIYRN